MKNDWIKFNVKWKIVDFDKKHYKQSAESLAAMQNNQPSRKVNNSGALVLNVGLHPGHAIAAHAYGRSWSVQGQKI